MPLAARLGDIAVVPSDSHLCISCAHSCSGPIIESSPDVMINSIPASRLGDAGIHSSCCGDNTYVISGASATVRVNGKGLARLSDQTSHCGGVGQITTSSPNVNVGG